MTYSFSAWRLLIRLQVRTCLQWYFSRLQEQSNSKVKPDITSQGLILEIQRGFRLCNFVIIRKFRNMFEPNKFNIVVCVRNVLMLRESDLTST